MLSQSRQTYGGNLTIGQIGVGQMLLRGQQYANLLDLSAGRRWGSRIRNDAAYYRHHAAVCLSQSRENTELPSAILSRDEQLQGWVIAAFE